MSAEDTITSQPWLQKTVSRKEHILIHETNRERAFSILKKSRIHGSKTHRPDATEAYPHFTIHGWPPVYNNTPVKKEIRLKFRCKLPARYRGGGDCTPERGWLEVYTPDVNPWQCCLHPDSSPIEFIGASRWTPNLAWNDRFFGRTLDAKLYREVKQAAREKRKIRAAFA